MMATKTSRKKSPMDTLKAQFLQEILEGAQDTSVPELMAKCVALAFFPKELLKRFERRGMAGFIHQIMQSIVDDDDGQRWREYGCIQVKGPDGEKTWRYRHKSRMTLRDYDQVCAYYRKQANRYRARYEHWYALRCQRFPNAPKQKRVTW
jgi:hypothetical protein